MRSVRTAAVMTGVCLAACGGTPQALQEPIADASRRATPLHFGVYVTPDPEQNPIDPPERFIGYHAATDFEVSQDELHEEVSVRAACGGKVLYSGHAEGYGGVLVQRCRVAGEVSTVLYGHLAAEGLPAIGVTLRAGEEFAVLADADSYDSGYTRKHLHFSVHRGADLELRGYVQHEEELEDFVDPQSVLPAGVVEEILPPIDPYWQSGTDGSVPKEE